MEKLEIKPHKRTRIELSIRDNKERLSYHTIINKDSNQLAQALIDLHLGGWDVERAVKIFLSRKKDRDWLGF